ncbi:unnamed protein product [Durusdinium trenchii]|uniref:Uncharacterized protein n=1 Tax=Durusdinium trenchii TaxID=1381693 RepID=A0ABP0LZW0_9DINO
MFPPEVGEQLSKTLSKYRCSDPNGNGPNGPATAGRAGLRPSCVLYDAQRDVITFADFVWSDELHGMSCVDRLCEALRPFADERYAEELRAGYAKTARCRGRRADCSGQQACFAAPCSPRSECSEDSDGQMARSNLCPTM